jgi:dihydrofolate synthase / folylpolyglutamate synthase
LPGRFQVLPGRPVVVLDVGHNPHAARALSASLRELPSGGRLMAVFAMLKDKDIAGVARPLKDQVQEWLVADLPGPRGADAARIEEALISIGVNVPISRFESPAIAYQSATRCAGQDDKILVFGSFFTVGAVVQTFV